MSTPDSAGGTTGQPASQEQKHEPQEPPGSVLLPNFLSPDRIVAQLSTVRTTQPVAALASANQHQRELEDVFLKAVERGVENPLGDFAEEGMLFNYATYFLAKWRDRRAWPLFLRWFSLPGEAALELGGDTVVQHGSRLLASVWNGEMEPLKGLILNREAHSVCRGQALVAVGVLAAWGEWPRPEAEATLLSLAREGLERTKDPVWNALAMVCVQLEFLAVFGELRRAQQEGLLESSVISPEELHQVEQAPRGSLIAEFTRSYPPITDVIFETRWWAGFHQQGNDGSEQAGAGALGPYVAPPRVGRNDLCPCGSGKKYKKCCGA